MVKKLFISLLIILIFYSTTILEHEKAQAASAGTASLAGGFAGVMAGITAVGAAAVGSKVWLDENIEDISATARETWGQMSQDMKDNFAVSMENAADGIVLTRDMMISALDVIKPSYQEYPKEYKIENDFFVFESGVIMTFNWYGTNYGIKKARVVSEKSGDYYIPVLQTDFYTFNGNLSTSPINREINSYSELRGIMSSLFSAATNVSFNKNGVPFGVNETYNSIDRYLREQAIPNGQLDNLRIPSPVPMTLDGTKLNYDPLTGTLTLPDGIPWEGNPTTDLVWNPPNIGVKTLDIDGVPTDIPVAQTADGAWIDIRTGEIVIPAENVPPIDPPAGEFENPKKALDFTLLIVVGNTLKEKFPFSLPWDFLKQLGIFNVEPESPKFNIGIDNYLEIGGHTIPMNFDLDLSMFDKVAAIVRWFTRIIWIVGLIFILRKLLPE